MLAQGASLEGCELLGRYNNELRLQSKLVSGILCVPNVVEEKMNQAFRKQALPHLLSHMPNDLCLVVVGYCAYFLPEVGNEFDMVEEDPLP